VLAVSEFFSNQRLAVAMVPLGAGMLNQSPTTLAFVVVSSWREGGWTLAVSPAREPESH